MLRVSLIGNLGKDPETRFTPKGVEIAEFSVAVNQFRLDKDGERQDSTEWFRIRVTGRSLNFAKQLEKGSRVFIAGRLDISHYTSRDSGELRTSYDVWADEIQAFSRRTESEGVPLSAGESNGSASKPRTRAPADPAEEDDLPF